MNFLFYLLVATSVTIDNVVIGQTTSIPFRRIALISSIIHLTLLSLGAYIAPHFASSIAELAHWMNSILFLFLACLSLWTTINHKDKEAISSIKGAMILSSFLALDAFILGLTPLVSDNFETVLIGVLLLSPIFVLIGRKIREGSSKIKKGFGYIETILFIGLAIHSL